MHDNEKEKQDEVEEEEERIRSPQILNASTAVRRILTSMIALRCSDAKLHKSKA